MSTAEVDVSPGICNLVFPRGDTPKISINLNMNLTGADVYAQAREGLDRSSRLIFDFDVVVVTPGTGAITVQPTAEGSALLYQEVSYWSLLVIDSLSTRRTYLAGTIQSDGNATRVEVGP